MLREGTKHTTHLVPFFRCCLFHKILLRSYTRRYNIKVCRVLIEKVFLGSKERFVAVDDFELHSFFKCKETVQGQGFGSFSVRLPPNCIR